MSLEIIKGIFPLSEDVTENYEDFLFLFFYRNVIEKDDYLSETYFQIERQIYRGLKYKDNKLYSGKKEISNNEFMSMPIFDRLGQVKPAKVIKKMISLSSVYEIRIDLAYEHHRVLFFPYNRDLDLLPALIFTYGFTKTKDNSLDMTQQLAEISQITRNQLYNQVKDIKIIGEVFKHGL